MTEKRCSKCKEIKPLCEFSKRGGARTSETRPSCKVCQYDSFKKWEAKRIGRPVLSMEQWKAEVIKRVYPTCETKICSKCKKEKNLSEFGVLSHKFQCKECRNEKESAVGIEKQAVRKAYRQKWRANNLELARECSRAGTEKRRVIKLSIETTLTREEWVAIIERYGGKCLRCGKQTKLTMDHVIPVSKGGPHSAANIQPLCGPCNSSKGRKIIDYRIQGGMTCQ